MVVRHIDLKRAKAGQLSPINSMQEETNLALSQPCYTTTQKLETGKILPPFPINLHCFIYISIFLVPKVIVIPYNSLKYLAKTKNHLPNYTWFSSFCLFKAFYEHITDSIFYPHVVLQSSNENACLQNGELFQVWLIANILHALGTPVAQNIYNYIILARRRPMITRFVTNS